MQTQLPPSCSPCPTSQPPEPCWSPGVLGFPCRTARGRTRAAAAAVCGAGRAGKGAFAEDPELWSQGGVSSQAEVVSTEIPTLGPSGRSLGSMEGGGMASGHCLVWQRTGGHRGEGRCSGVLPENTTGTDSPGCQGQPEALSTEAQLGEVLRKL